TGTTPPASLSPLSVSFGNQAVGTTSASRAVTLTNNVSKKLNISSIAISGANSGDFKQTNNCGTSIQGHGNCTINVTFTPAGTGARSATLTVTDSASNSPQTASLSGTGTAPAVTLTPSSVPFGNQLVSTASAAQAVTLSNTGTSPLTISSIAIGGTNPGDFGQTNNCPISPSTLAASASCTINITFTPTAAGSRSASLAVSDNATGSSQTASLSGTGTVPTVTLTPSSVPFGNQQVSTTSAPQVVTLSNTGSAPLTITSIALGGTNPAHLGQTHNCPLSPSTLAASTSCTINVTFTPTATSARAATLAVTDN